MSVGILLLIGCGMVLLYLVGTLLETPLKLLFKLLLNGLLGSLALVTLNMIGTVLSFSLAVNPLSALTVGFLGIPGLVLIVALKLVIV